MQTGTGQVYPEAETILLDDGMDQQVRSITVHIRTRQAKGAVLIDDGIFDLLRDELGVNKLFCAPRGTDGQGLPHRQVILPVNHLGAGVKIIGADYRPFGQQQNHAIAKPREHDDPVSRLQGGRTVHACNAGFDLRDAEAAQFPFQQGFDAL